MPLLKIDDFDSSYQEALDGNDIKGMSVYTQENNEKIGTVSDIIVDDQGQFRYLAVDLGFWIFGKKVLLPIGRAQIDDQANRVYAIGMTRAQAEALPEFPTDLKNLDYDHEEQVRGVYRTQPTTSSASMSAMAAGTSTPTYNRDTYTYDQDASLYDVNSPNAQNIKLYQERLVANKKRVKTGEVAIGKHVETETQKVSVPIEKERVVVERVTPADAGRAVAPGSVTFGESEVTRMEIYEETPDIRKEAFVREEVKVKKVTEQETVEAQETLRREELNVDTEGRPVVDGSERI